MKYAGFTLIELMIVVAIIAFLSMISVPSLMKHLAKAKRAEAYINLRALAMAEKTYFAEHGYYTDKLSGPDSLDWQPEGNFNYTYGFAGSEGKNFISGQLKIPGSDLSGSKADTNSFIAVAAGDIDGDGKPDIISIDQNNKITIVQDDLT